MYRKLRFWKQLKWKILLDLRLKEIYHSIASVRLFHALIDIDDMLRDRQQK